MTDRAVILAAGRGGRLERHTDGRAKCLVPVAGRPLIDYVLTSLARAGIREALVVLGHHGEQVEAHVGDGGSFGLAARYVWNHGYDRGNASSLWAALPAAQGEPFLLVMSDHLCSAALLRAFLSCAAGRSAIAVDRSDLGTARLDEATKVALADGLVLDIGKGLERWQAVDTGVSHWPAGAFGGGALEPGAAELSALMAAAARDGAPVAACDVSGHFWLDVDTEDDIRLAEELLRADERRLD